MPPQIRYTTEPPRDSYKPLESDIFENEEYYIYMYGDYEFVRRKIGGWVNMTRFFPLIKEDDDDLASEVLEMQPSYNTYQKHNPERYNGIWTTTDKARLFAKEHGIIEQTGPLLNFNRVALVKYMGFSFFEYFACPAVDISIRILRVTDNERANSNERVNMNQIFLTYKKYKGKKAKLQLERSFFHYFKDIVKKGDATLCGGNWVKRTDVIKFVKKHGFHQILKPILDFPDSNPAEMEQYPIDIIQRQHIRYWKATSCDDQFYGFPRSFKGGLAPKRPKLTRKNKMFSFTDLTLEKRLNIESVKGKQKFRKSTALLRRLSDGAVNASTLVSICILLKLNELNLGDDDPDFLVTHELYQRDRLENIRCETVALHSSKYLNGKWCSIYDARRLFAEFNLKSKDAVKVKDFLNHSTLKEDGADKVVGDGSMNDEEDDDQIEAIPESSFASTIANSTKDTIYYDKKFFEDESSSADEGLILADYDDDLDLEDQRYDIDHHVEEVENNTGDEDEQEQDDEDEDYDEQIFRRGSKRRFSTGGPNGQKKQKLFVVADDEDDTTASQSQDSPKLRSKEKTVEEMQQYEPENYVDMFPAQEIDYSQENNAGGIGSDDDTNKSLFEEDEEDPDREEQETQKVVDSLKKIASKIDFLVRQDPRDRKIQRTLKKQIDELQKFRAIDQEIQIQTKLVQSLRYIKNYATGYSRTFEELEQNWNKQGQDQELPSMGEIRKLPERSSMNPGNTLNQPVPSAHLKVQGQLYPQIPTLPQYSPQPVTNFNGYPPAPRGYSVGHGQYTRGPPPPVPHGSRRPPPLPQPTQGPPPSSGPGQNYQHHVTQQVFYKNGATGRQNPPSRHIPAQRQRFQQLSPQNSQALRGHPSPTMRNVQLIPGFVNQGPKISSQPRSGDSSPNPNIPSGPHKTRDGSSSSQSISQVGHGPRTSSSQSTGGLRLSSGPTSTTSENPQSRYRERPGSSYISLPYKRKTSINSKLMIKKAIEDRQKSLSPPSNYLQLSGEGLDVEDISLDDYEDMIKENEEIKAEFKSQQDPLDQYRKIVHFETRTRQDLFKRAKVIFQPDPTVPFFQRLHIMMKEKYIRSEKRS